MATISERLQYVLQFDTRQAVGALQQVGKAGDDAFDNTGGKLDRLGGNLTKFGAGAMAFAGVAGMGLWKLGKGASALNEGMNAARVTFGEAGDEILALGDKSAKAMGISKREFLQLATGFSAFAQNIAGDGGDVAATIETISVRASDFASIMDMDVSRAMQLFRRGLAGETESLRQFGIDVSAATVEAYALSSGITDNAKTMTEAQKQAARWGTIMEQTEHMAGDFARTSGDLANAQRILDAEMANLKDNIGTGLLPMMKAIVSVGADVTGVFAQLSPEVQNTIGKFAGIGVAGVGVIGALSFIGGQAIKLRDRFTTLGADGTRSLNKLGMAARGLGTAFAIAAGAMVIGDIVNRVSGASEDAAENVQELNIAIADLGDAEAMKEFRDIVADIDKQIDFSNIITDWGKRVVVAGGVAARSIEDVDKAFNQVLKQSGPEAARALISAWERQNATLDVSSQQYADNVMLIERYREKLDTAAGSAAALTKIEQDANNERLATENALDGQLNIMSDVEIAAGRMGQQQEESAEEAAQAWQEWADALLGASEAAQTEYDDMVDAAQGWADAQRSAMNIGSDSFASFTADADTSAADYIAAQQKMLAGLRQWEWDLAVIYQSLRTGTTDEKLAYIANLREMGNAGAPLVARLSADASAANQSFGLFTEYAGDAKDGMLGEFDPVATELDRRMGDAKRALVNQMIQIENTARNNSKTIGSAIPEGVIEGVQGGMPALNWQMRLMISQALAAAKAASESRSPSKLFAREVGLPITEGIAAGIDEGAHDLVESLEKAIKDGEEAAVEAAEDLVDAAQDVLDGIWDGIDEGRDLVDMQEDVAEAQANLNEVMADPKSTPKERADAVERLEDANLKLAKSMIWLLNGADDQRQQWIAMAEAAGLTVEQINALTAAYAGLKQAAVQGSMDQGIALAESQRAKNILYDFAYAVAHGWVSPEALASIQAQPSYEAQLTTMAGWLNAIQAYFGAPLKQYSKGTRFHTGGMAIVGEEGPELVNMPRGTQVTPNNELAGMGQTTNNIYVTVNGADPNVVVAAIRKYVKTNGPIRGVT